jgi:hypothetical protein
MMIRIGRVGFGFWRTRRQIEAPDPEFHGNVDDRSFGLLAALVDRLGGRVELAPGEYAESRVGQRLQLRPNDAGGVTIWLDKP